MAFTRFVDFADISAKGFSSSISLYAARIYPQFYIQLIYTATLSFTLKFKWQPILSQKSSKIQTQN